MGPASLVDRLLWRPFRYREPCRSALRGGRDLAKLARDLDTDLQTGLPAARAMGVSAVVLLDGDADIFADEYLRDKVSGGRRAAIELYERIFDLLAPKVSDGEPRIFVQIFMNLPGLQACLGPACHLPSFVASFNRSAYPMSIVDTGSLRKGDQAADLALNKRLRFFAASAEFILLGGSHDAGYAATILQLGAGGRKKVTLVRTGPFVAQEIRELGLPEVEFTTVFRWHDPTKPFVPLSAQAEPIRPEVETHRTERPMPTPTPVPPMAAITRTPSQPVKYIPLIAVIKSNSFERAKLTWVRDALAKVANPPFTNLNEYVAEAEAAGIVVTGVGGPKGLDGHAWVKLVPSLQQCDGNSETTLSGASPSNSTSPSQTPQAPTSVPSSTSYDFAPLVAALRASPVLKPLRSYIGDKLSGYQPKLYKNFKDYIVSAGQAGIVELGREEEGKDWIRLVLVSRSVVPLGPAPVAAAPPVASLARSSSPSPSLSPPPALTFIPRSILPLVTYLRQPLKDPSGRVPFTLVGADLKKDNPAYLEAAGFRALKDYVEAAVRGGIMTTGNGDKAGTAWVRLEDHYR